MPVFSRLAQQNSTTYSSLRGTKMFVTYSLDFSSWIGIFAKLLWRDHRLGRVTLIFQLHTSLTRLSFSGQTFHEDMLHRRFWSNSVLGTLIYNSATLLSNVAAFSSSWTFDILSHVPSPCPFRLSRLALRSQRSSAANHLSPVCPPLGSELLSHDSGAVFFWFIDS